MKRYNTQLIVLILCLFANFHAPAQNQTNVKSAIDLAYEKFIKKNKVVGASIAVVDNGKIVYANGFGFADLENEIKANATTIMPIGSATKTFTALAVMQLQEKKLLNIDESIKKYIPELTIKSRFDDGNEIYIKDILSHVSGLPSDILNGTISESPKGMDWIIDELNKQTTIAPNRMVYAYSNVGYALLGELIERVSGQSFDDYLNKNIFLPLEMPHTSAKVHGQISKGYLKKKTTSFSTIRDKAAGVITSTVTDMSNFIIMIMNNGTYKGKRIISEKTLSAMTRDHLLGISLQSSEAYGYGISVFPIQLTDGNEEKIVQGYGHSGYLPPFHFEYRYIPSTDIGVCVMTNTNSSGNVRSAGTLLDIYLKEAKQIDYKLLGKESDIPANCSDEDIPGFYNLQGNTIAVSNLDKIRFRMFGTKIILKRKGTSYNYSITAKLFGFVPINVKDEYLRFVKIENQVYLIEKNINRKTENFLTSKVEKKVIPDPWRKSYGYYEIINAQESAIPEFDFSNAKVKLTEKKGFVLLDIKTPDGQFPFTLKIENNTIAYTDGIGRHMNYQVRILENGNLYFNGFEMKKI